MGGAVHHDIILLIVAVMVCVHALNIALSFAVDSSVGYDIGYVVVALLAAGYGFYLSVGDDMGPGINLLFCDICQAKHYAVVSYEVHAAVRLLGEAGSYELLVLDKVLDKNGKTLFSYRKIESPEGFWTVKNKDFEWGVVADDGTVLIPLKYACIWKIENTDYVGGYYRADGYDCDLYDNKTWQLVGKRIKGKYIINKE